MAFEVTGNNFDPKNKINKGSEIQASKRLRVLGNTKLACLRAGGAQWVRLLCVLVMASFFGLTAQACQYPCKPIRLIVPAEPGGGIDAMARMVALALADELKATVVILNKGGAAGNLGTAFAATALNDGYTLLVTGLGHISSALLSRQPGYDPIQDFEPIAKIAEAPNVLLINSGLRIDNVKDLVRLSREKPGFITFGANGGSNLISAEIFQNKNNLNWLHVPYKGSGPALRAAMSGETDLIFIAANLANQAVETGKVKALAVAHPKRLGYLHGVPTMKEAGISGVESSQWYGVLAPDGTPPYILEIIERVIKDDLENNGKLQKYLQGNHLEAAFMGRQDFKKFMLDEAHRIKRLNIEITN